MYQSATDHLKTYDLYEVAQAKPKRKVSDAQRAVLDRARVAAEIKSRTCRRCGVVQEVVYGLDERGRCMQCVGQAQERRHARDRAAACRWAWETLQRTDVVVLDTETTDIEAALMCQIAIIDLAGAVLLDTLVNPGQPISEGAIFVHGITDAMVADAPTFADLVPQMEQLLHDKTVLAYNADFDAGVIARHTRELWGYTAPTLAWNKRISWLDLMEPYAAVVGQWHDYYRSYTWQPLPGGDHTAVGDCRAALDVLKEMASEHQRTLDQTQKGPSDD